MSCDVSVYGKNNTTIKIKWSLWNKVTIRDFQRSRYIKELDSMGFKKVILYGYNEYWTINIGE